MSPVVAADGPVPAVHAAVEPVALDTVDGTRDVPVFARKLEPSAALCPVDAAYVAVPVVPANNWAGEYAYASAAQIFTPSLTFPTTVHVRPPHDTLERFAESEPNPTKIHEPAATFARIVKFSVVEAFASPSVITPAWSIRQPVGPVAVASVPTGICSVKLNGWRAGPYMLSR